MKSLLSMLLALSTVLSLSLTAFAKPGDEVDSLSPNNPSAPMGENLSINPGAEPNDNSSGKVGMSKQEASAIALGIYPDCSTCRANLVQKLLGAQTTKKEDYANLLPAGYKSGTPAAGQKGAQ